MNKINISSGVKRIEVNDAGEYITLPVGDDSFIQRFTSMMDEIQKQAEKLKMDEQDILGSMANLVAVDESIKEKIESLFGEGTCRKVFGDILPGIDMFLEFFEQLLPFIEEHQKSRTEKMNKYSASRAGSSV